MSTILTTIRWLSIFIGALSLFYLGNAWFEFGLGEAFTRIYAWYASGRGAGEAGGAVTFATAARREEVQR